MPTALSVMWLGVGVMVVGFAAKWTDRTFGLAQVLNPDLFEWLRHVGYAHRSRRRRCGCGAVGGGGTDLATPVSFRAGHPGDVLRRVVDALPLRLWRPGNLFLGGRLHFCSDGVRTVEWKGREVARGRHEFPFDEVERRWPA